MYTVYKYPFDVTDFFTLDLPQGAKFLYLDVQFEVPCMWFLVNPNAVKERRYFRVYGTGHAIDVDKKTHIGSFMMRGGTLVFHVFENEVPE